MTDDHMIDKLIMRLQAVQDGSDRPYAASVAKDAKEAIKALVSERDNLENVVSSLNHNIDHAKELMKCTLQPLQWRESTVTDREAAVADSVLGKWEVWYFPNGGTYVMKPGEHQGTVYEGSYAKAKADLERIYQRRIAPALSAPTPETSSSRSELATWLRQCAGNEPASDDAAKLWAAADEIERLRIEFAVKEMESIGYLRAVGDLQARLAAATHSPSSIVYGIETAPSTGSFLAESRDGDWIIAERYSNPFGRKNTVISNRLGKWWSPSRWMPIPPTLSAIATDTTPAPSPSGWRSMETAPQDREILLDASYWYPDDTHVTACYLIGCWDDNLRMWDCVEESRRSSQVHAWMDIPHSLLQPDGTLTPTPTPKA